jgi:colicin import membrane protein
LIRGFTGSLLLHGGLLAWAVLGFSMSTPLPQPVEIAVEVAEISMLADVTKQMKGDTTSKNNEVAPAPDKPQPVVMQQVAPKPTPTPPPPPPVETAPPPPPEPVKAPEPPKPVEPPKAAEVPPAEDKEALKEMLAAEDSKAKAEAAAAAKAAKQKAEAEAKAKAEAKAAAKAAEIEKQKIAAAKAAAAAVEAEKKKAAELAKKPKFDPNSIASAIDGAKAPDLLDKTPKAKGAPPVGAQTASVNPNAPKGPNAGTSTGTSNVNQARDKDLILARLDAAFQKCWSKPSAGSGIPAPAVKVFWKMNKDGTLGSDPKILETDKNSPLADQAERAAVRAVQACAPFNLPPDLYGMWRELAWTFDPNKTF